VKGLRGSRQRDCSTNMQKESNLEIVRNTKNKILIIVLSCPTHKVKRKEVEERRIGKYFSRLLLE